MIEKLYTRLQKKVYNLCILKDIQCAMVWQNSVDLFAKLVQMILWHAPALVC